MLRQRVREHHVERAMAEAEVLCVTFGKHHGQREPVGTVSSGGEHGRDCPRRGSPCSTREHRPPATGPAWAVEDRHRRQHLYDRGHSGLFPAVPIMAHSAREPIAFIVRDDIGIQVRLASDVSVRCSRVLSGTGSGR